MKIRFTNPDPRDFPTLGMVEVVSGQTADLPAEVAKDLIAQDVAVAIDKPKEK